MRIPKGIANLLKGGETGEIGVDGFQIRLDDPLRNEHLVIDRYLVEAKQGNRPWWQTDGIPYLPTYQAILKSEPETQVRIVLALAERQANLYQHIRKISSVASAWENEWRMRNSMHMLSTQLLRRQLPFRCQDLAALLDSLARFPYLSNEYFPLGSLLSQIERVVESEGLTSELRGALKRFRRSLQERSSRERKIKRRIAAILGEDDRRLVAPGEPWSDALLAERQRMAPEEHGRWDSLFQHAMDASGSRPSAKWLQSARKLLDPIGDETFTNRMSRWLTNLGGPAKRPMPEDASALLKGLAWTCSLVASDELARALGEAAAACFQKVPNYGMRAQKAGNACVYALGAMPGLIPVSELARVQRRVKYANARRLIDVALESAAERQGLERADLDELAVPDFGLDTQGKLVERLGDYRAEVAIQSTFSVTLNWRNPQGKPLKSAPAAVKRDYPEALATLRRTQKAIRETLPVQRDRIERLLTSQRAWGFAAWSERYLEHPLVAQIARRLIWHFRLGDRNNLGIWLGGALVDVNGRPLEWLAAGAQVRLWHPIGFDPDTILAWRVFLEEHGITQPFKQAHREVYILTDAEIQTLTYSNRFAAHVLKQHQLAALCRERGWKYTLQGGWDSHNCPTLDLPEANLSAEFWVEGAGDHFSDSGIYLYVSTDQVRFYDMRNQRLPLSEVPALYLSEILRDVDLFVGVCSVGNDPAWRDRGEARDYGNYWHSYSFGNLTATAQTRKEVLERLLPRLKIADRCRIVDRFLIVRGQRRTYKIHLGSGNILMEPNDQYLCIVPDRSASVAGDRLFLPFEGDQTLALILSKAFLLAEDTKIKDPTILSQIARR